MAKYYCQVSGEKRGPMGSSELRQLAQRGVLRPDDLVWEENTNQKVPARKVNGLFGPVSRPAAVSAPATGVPAVGAPVIAARTAVAPVVPPKAPQAKAPAPSGPPPIPPPLPFAAPTAAAPAAFPLPASAPVIQNDAGPVFKLGKQFSYSQGGKWGGAVYASSGAIYLVKAKKVQQSYGGGLAGALIAAAASSGPDDTRTCSVGELPEVVRSAVDPKGKLGAKDAIILPRGAVSFVKMGGINNLITVDCGGEKFKLATSLFKGKVRKSLIDAGWMLNEAMTPTVAAIHGRGFGRTEGAPPVKQMSTAKRVLLIFLAVALIIGVIALRVWMDTSRESR